VDKDFIDPPTLHTDNFETRVLPKKTVTRPRQAPETINHKSGKGMEITFTAHIFKAEQIFDLVDRCHTIDHPAAIGTLHGLTRGILCMAGNVAGDGFDNIRDRDEAFDTSILIDDHGSVLPRLLELIEKPQDGCCIGYN